MNKDTQCKKILKYIEKNGSITVRQAFTELNINSPTRRFTDLERKGYALKRTRVDTVNSAGESSHYNVYSLDKIRSYNVNFWGGEVSG